MIDHQIRYANEPGFAHEQRPSQSVNEPGFVNKAFAHARSQVYLHNGF